LVQKCQRRLSKGGFKEPKTPGSQKSPGASSISDTESEVEEATEEHEGDIDKDMKIIRETLRSNS
jgi:hypothetical protein